jgi:Flp pilus assembly protein TadG
MTTRIRIRLRQRPSGPALIRRCLADRSGAAAILFALLLVPMLGAMGLAIDASLAFMVESRLSKSLDAAALAAGRVADSEDAEAIALSYFNANFANSGAEVTLDGLDFAYDDDAHEVTMTAKASVPTHFARVFGIDSMAVDAKTVVERRVTGMELALVLDITGSMRGSMFNAMQAAALELTTSIFADQETVENLYVSLVPYVASVNAGSSRKSWLKTGDKAITSPGLWADDPKGWKGCVEARAYPYDSDDTPPSLAPFTSYLYPKTSDDADDNKFPPVLDEKIYGNNARGPNLGCGAPIVPLTSSRAKIDGGLKAMAAWARGGTAGNLGLAWGWRTLSPRWRGLWGGDTPATFPLDYGTPLMEKAVVILTDGKNEFYDNSNKVGSPKSDYTAYGRIEEQLKQTSLNEGRKILDARTAETCSAMKAKGITIYAITFGTGVDATSQALFEGCADEPSMYFHAPTSAELATVFRTIAGELASLRIKQ